MELFEVVYVSAAKAPFSPAALRELLAKARTNNARINVTGMLIYAQGSFLQILEGAEADVDTLYEKISRDDRHYRVIRVFSKKTDRRSFGDWTMGYLELDAKFAALPGFNDFLRKGFTDTKSTTDLETKVREVADQFRIGRWRQHIHG
jgi:hypothetical protein